VLEDAVVLQPFGQTLIVERWIQGAEVDLH
jgi:hypothetical protein